MILEPGDITRYGNHCHTVAPKELWSKLCAIDSDWSEYMIVYWEDNLAPVVVWEQASHNFSVLKPGETEWIPYNSLKG